MSENTAAAGIAETVRFSIVIQKILQLSTQNTGAAPYPEFFVETYMTYMTYMNYGYWENGTRDCVEACENLLRKLIAPMTDTTGRILDVGCGLGFTTRFLCTFWNPEHVYGIDISEALIARCRENAPKCNFGTMDATALGFDNEFFDNVISVEAVFHFHPRRAFYGEALRVLKPGGVLALTDFANHKDSVPEYRARLLDAGFAGTHVDDFTAHGADAYFRFI